MKFLALVALLSAGAVNLSSAPLPQHAAAYRTQLSQRILPYWLGKLDSTNGGYLLSDDAVRGATPSKEKQLVSQARMIWTFAHAHRHGLDDAKNSCLQAAENGYRFLTDHFLDARAGGYYWQTDPGGHPVNERKLLYGEAFVIYAFVELHRATRDPKPLAEALQLYRLLQQHAHDDRNGGWYEHFDRDWKQLADHDPNAEVEVAGYKSANAHLHLQEAFAELYEVTHEAAVKQSLIEVLDLNKRYFYPKAAGESCFHRQRDWQAVTDPKSAGLSYGHNVEFAWLMIRAEEVLGRLPDWPHFDAHLQHALLYGYDHERGGLFSRGVANHPAHDQEKTWWVEAEMMAALTVAVQHQDNTAQRRALDQLIHFVNAYQTDPRSGIWLDTVTAAGQPKRTGLAHAWKANYHDVRALVKFVEAFPPPPP